MLFCFFPFPAEFTRPVVIVGGLADLVRMKLLKEMPDKFDLPSKYFQSVWSCFHFLFSRGTITTSLIGFLSQ